MKSRIRRLLIVGAALFALLAAAVVGGLPDDIVITRHQLGVVGVQQPVRVVVVSDTHSCEFDDAQQQIANLVRAENPDVIALAGDIVDDVLPMQRGLDTVARMPEIAPTFYVPGNHEYWSERSEEIVTEIAGMGIHVLVGGTERIEVNGQQLTVAGLGDPEIDEYAPVSGNLFDDQVGRLRGELDGSPTLLLSHRPELTGLYEGLDVDVIVSGHAHGGQWRIPLILDQGMYAPNQGFFPSYANGVHELAGDRQLVVSRGLACSQQITGVPRLYNKREIVVLDLVAA